MKDITKLGGWLWKGWLFLLGMAMGMNLHAASIGEAAVRFEFKQLTISNPFFTEEVQKVYQDKEGFVWLATRYGFFKYDGYGTTLFKSNLYSPDLLTNNNIYCLADDNDFNLWVGTQEGLNVLNKKTGEIRKYLSPAIPSSTVSCLLVDKKNRVWVGTDSGLCRYIAERDSFVVYNSDNSDGVFKYTSIKSLCEDSEGDLWIGTWEAGLYRYSPSEEKFYAYPPINAQNSAHVIYEDSRKNIWVGSWAQGLFQLVHPKDMERVSYIRYTHVPSDASSLSDDLVYDIAEDPHTHTLWIGTRSGLSVMGQEHPGMFTNYGAKQSYYHLPCNEINSIFRDRFGYMWLGSIGGGVLMADTYKPPFVRHAFSFCEEEIPATSVKAVFVDADRHVWLGIGNYGLARQDYATGNLTLYSHLPEFKGINSVPTINAIMQRRNGDIWFGTYDGGLLIYRKGKPVERLFPQDCGFLASSCVSALYEDEAGNCWVGTRGNLGVRQADGSEYKLGVLDFGGGHSVGWLYVKDIIQDSDHSFWLATGNCGIVHLPSGVRKPVDGMKCDNYSLYNGKLQTNNVLCLHLDRKGRLWAGTEGGGLYLYNRSTQQFEAKNRTYKIPGDMVASIEEDDSGTLWLGTNAGLVKLGISEEGDESTVRVYTVADGLEDNFFLAKSSCQWKGELFFGGLKGYNSFFPSQLEERVREVPFLITDIKIYNRSFNAWPPEVRHRISSQTPPFTEKIVLPHAYNDFSVEFAALTYKNPELNQYAYRLDGFDKDWQFTTAERRFAYYNRLPSGTYTFRLRATNENGVWSNSVRQLTVVVLPPFWATWWAYLLYLLLAAAVAFYLYRTVRNRMLLKNELRMREVEKEKVEELNHVKLQFFTNITHELLTPLTIISATVDELKMQASDHRPLYDVMNTNIRRLIRLLQQILEFRKAETGNLRLRVSRGDLGAFVRQAAESFQPLVRKQKIHFSVLCDPESLFGYFDPDKLDKIIYNLLSNAAKYNRENGYIQLNLSYDDDPDFVLLRIKDNGMGISKEKQRNLFQRFYEGDYRRYNTIGTGIGLSLVKDLVELHQGTISVISEQGQGTEFDIRLPMDRSYFTDEQIDNESSQPVASGTENYPEEEESDKAEEAPVAGKEHTLLLVEDNEELLHLMVQLLRRDYNICTAANGREAVEMLKEEDVHLIVSDVMMPEMDGFELCKYVKAQLELSHIPVILLTVKDKEEDRAEAYEAGADAFLHKPFNLAVLHARIRNLLKYRERRAHDFKNQLFFEVKDLNYTSLDEDFMQRAVDCVNRHLDDYSFDQPQFAEEMKTSKSTLYKKLKSLTGLNTSSFIRNVRLKAACRIMEEKGGAIRISELAYAVGFNDPKYFSSCFKKEFGMLPSEYVTRFVQKE